MPRALPTPQREVIFRRFEQGQSARAIADELGLSHSTVKKLLVRFQQQGKKSHPAQLSRLW